MGIFRKDPEKQEEASYEIGMDEMWKYFLGLLAKNAKRTYDVYQQLDIENARLAQAHVAEVLANSRNSANRVMIIGERALSNLVGNCDALFKQHLAHRDVAVDATWYPGPGEEFDTDK